MSMFKELWHHHRLLLCTFVVTLVVVLFFAVRLAAFLIYWADPAHRDQAIAGWMTPAYVIQSWDVPREVVRDIVGPPSEGRRQRLSDIASARGISLDELVGELMSAIEDHRTK